MNILDAKMRNCPACRKTSSTVICNNCGFDCSRDYEHYPTFSLLPFSSYTVSKLRERQCGPIRRLRCPVCEGTDFHIDLSEDHFICAKCGHMLEQFLPEDPKLQADAVLQNTSRSPFARFIAFMLALLLFMNCLHTSQAQHIYCEAASLAGFKKRVLLYAQEQAKEDQ